MNYMQWGHEESEIRVWKRGADVTASTYPFGCIPQVLVFMENGVELPTILGNPVVAWHMKDQYVTLKIPDRNWTDYEDWLVVDIKPATMDMLKKLKDMGWIQSRYYEGRKIA